ncbi:Hypothetical predicted protein [Octopus vulgaris]|uniref:Uncharacterized protein n=1 Tax=Octopus vulgaris TaxID=6645 RepID=A0AA36BYX9_OCTVU|nr:Hypothetical predicted protein [Octopus vulgaris]
MEVLLLALTTILAVTSDQEFEFTYYKRLRPGYSYGYIGTSSYNNNSTPNHRRFYITDHGGCPREAGWLAVIESSIYCDYDNLDYFPAIRYSNTESKVTWSNGNTTLLTNENKYFRKSFGT